MQRFHRILSDSGDHEIPAEYAQRMLLEIAAFSDSPQAYLLIANDSADGEGLQSWFSYSSSGDNVERSDPFGSWSECRRQLAAVRINRNAARRRRSEPGAGVSVLRELTMPVVRDGRVVALVGVRNGTQPYSRKDEARLALLADLLWEGIRGRRIAEKLRDSETFQSKLLDAIPIPVYYKDKEERYLGFNRAFEVFFGASREQMIGKSAFDISPPELAKIYHAQDLALFQSGGIQQYESQVKVQDGELREVMFTKAVFTDSQGKTAGLIGTVLDLTEHKKAEEALRISEERYRTIFHNAPLGIFRSTFDGRFLDANPATVAMLGYDSAEELVREVKNIGTEIYCDPSTRSKVMSEQLLKDGSSLRTDHFRRRDGSEFIANLYLKTVRDANGEPLYINGIVEDITERIEAAEEKERLEHQFYQIQKMESIGSLAGGVAHDFNNMLGVIIGRAQMAMRRLTPEHAAHANLEEILKAAQRSAKLTAQLLAFARKQAVAPRILDLNETVEGMLKMLRRLIGEEIELQWLPGKDLLPVKIDPVQIDQILANLCVNARDAIEGAGRIAIETAPAVFDKGYCAAHAGFSPGCFVMLAVSDDGCGMAQEILDMIFEPFFTTKDSGQGTGLGLATVYGIVKQNRGFINVYSEAGIGTTFKIYLPTHHGAVEPLLEYDRTETLATGHETILLVEDEPTFLDMTSKMLESFGYQVFAAGSPEAALRLARESEQKIHLLLTDVIMPGMNGRQLAKKVAKLQPGLRCLFMSGYTANVIAHHGVLDPGIDFLQKPFSLSDLAGKVRTVLAQSRRQKQ